jgi:hypothetical protein
MTTKMNVIIHSKLQQLLEMLEESNEYKNSSIMGYGELDDYKLRAWIRNLEMGNTEQTEWRIVMLDANALHTHLKGL